MQHMCWDEGILGVGLKAGVKEAEGGGGRGRGEKGPNFRPHFAYPTLTNLSW